MHRPNHTTRTAALLALCTASSCVFDSDRRPLLDAELGAASAYICRGQTFTERPVARAATVAQLPVKGGGSLALGALGILELSDSIGDAWAAEGAGGEFTQTDLWFGYTTRWAGFEGTLGARHYSWPRGAAFRFAPFPSTSEAFARIGRTALGLDVGLTLHYDFDAVGSLYSDLEAVKAWPLGDRFDLEVRAFAAWSDAEHGRWLYRRRTAGLADAGAEVALRAALDEVTSARLSVTGSSILDATYRDWFDDNGVAPDVVFATLGFVWAF